MTGAAGSDATRPEPVLRVEHLTTVFDTPSGPAPAVSDISLDIAPGEVLALVGESGCGKSVTALSLLRLVRPPGRIAAGRILFRGRDLLALDDESMRQVRGASIALIFQEPMTALNPVFTIGDQIGEAMLVHGRVTRHEARRRAIELLESVRIADAVHRVDDYPHQLSGGMRQRVLIAMALACRPALVIADEPTTALDVTIQAEVLDLLGEMRRAYNLSLLLITHDLGVVAGVADRVAVMYAGRIVEEAPVRTIFRAPAHPYTRALLASLPDGRPGHRLPAIEGIVPDLASQPPGCAFEPRCHDRFEPCPTAPPPGYAVGAGHTARCYLHRGAAVGDEGDVGRALGPADPAK